MNWFCFCVQLVVPKRKRLKEAQSLLAQHMSHLNEKRGELKEVMDKLQNLNDDYRSKVNKKRVSIQRDQHLKSPYNIHTMSSRQVIRIKIIPYYMKFSRHVNFASSICSLVMIWKIRHKGPVCSFVCSFFQ